MDERKQKDQGAPPAQSKANSKPMRARRPAQIIADTVNVCCPYCGEPQPSPEDESDRWTPQMLSSEAKRSAQRICVACDEAFYLHTRSTAQIAHVHVRRDPAPPEKIP